MSGLFSRPSSQSTAPTLLNAIAINQSTFGNPVPLVYGQTRIGLTLLWYGDFTATAVTTSGGGKGGGNNTPSSYNYRAALILGLCEGPIVSIGRVWKDKAITSLAAEGMLLFPGTSGNLYWSFTYQNFPEQAVTYDHTAYVASSNYPLGNSAQIPNLNFEVTGFVPYNVAGGIPDAEPSAILVDYCTSPHHGAGFAYLDPGIQGPGNTWQSYCIAMGFFISPQETAQRGGIAFVNELLQVTNSNAVWSAGVLRINPYVDVPVSGNGRTFTPNLTPIYSFFDSDFLPSSSGSGGASSSNDPLQVSITPANAVFNNYKVEFLDRSNSYNINIAPVSDANDITQNGLRTAPTVSLHSITSMATATTVGRLIMQRQLYVRSIYTFSVRADFCLLEPMDLIAINDPAAGIVDMLVRITEIIDDQNDILSLTCEEMLVGPASAPLYDTEAAAGYAANYGIAPGSIQIPYIFESPPLLEDPRTGGYALRIAACGQNGQPWGGCDVYMSFDNATYQHVGTITSAARYGTLTASYASGLDPDTTDTLSVVLGDNELAIASGTKDDADNMRTLLYVDGELMSYKTATLTGVGAYSFTSYMRRGTFGTAIASHVSGSPWARVDSNLFRLPYDPAMIGKVAYLKFPSFNIYGGAHESLAAVPAYTYTLAATIDAFTNLQLVSSFTTTGIGYQSHGAGNVIASYAVSNYPYPVALAISTFGMVAYTPGAGSSNQVSHYIQLSNGAAEDQIFFQAPQANFPLIARTVLNLAANFGAFTLYSILGKSVIADTCTISNASIYVEIVKR
jgi:hypothetical protein